MKAQQKSVVIDWCIPVLSELDLFVTSFGDKFGDHFEYIDFGPDVLGNKFQKLSVKTLEGISYFITERDVIIRGIKGGYYPCKKDIFELTYDII